MAIQSTTWEVDASIQRAFYDFMVLQPIQPKIIWDNVGFAPANDATAVVSTDTQVTGKGWILFEVLHDEGEIAALGTTMNRHEGTLSASIYFETNRGRVRSTAKIADQILDFYQTVDVAGVLKRFPRKETIGSDLQGWWQVNVLADFQYDIVR
jgi:hypothetical protein